MSDVNKTYFAARESEQCANAALNKARTFYNDMSMNSYLTKLKKMWKFYYGNFNQGSSNEHSVSFTGEQGELVNLPVNMFRNLARHVINIITANRPILESRAINTDYKSLTQTYLANGILDYYMREKGLENRVYDAVEMAYVMGSAFIEMEWNATAGESYDFDQETGEYNYEGEIEFTTHDPLSVVVDGTMESFDDKEWILIRTFQNRYNLAAKYPELADKIMALPTKDELYGYKFSLFSNDETDDIAVFKFYHKKTEAMPEGRYMLFVSDDIVLLDMPLPYRTIPVFRLAPANIMGTPYGYSELFDAYPIQEALNQSMSTILTNQAAFGVQNVFVPRGADISYESIDGSMNIIEGNAKPEAINLTQTPAEIFNFASMLQQLGETQVGVNSVTRGNPEASLRSGNSLALVQSMSLQFQSSFQRNYVKFLEDVGSSLIEILKDFAKTPKMIALVGKNKRPFLKEFTGDMISDIRRVIVDVGNPLSRTLAGRVEIANNLANMKLIKTPEQYFTVMETGRVDTLYEADMMDLFLIKRENEELMEGRDVYADPLDQHKLHIMEHRAVISDPELRLNPELTEKVRRHIQEHIDMLRTVDPDLLQMMGQQPLNPEPIAAGNPNLPPGPMNQNGQPMGNSQVMQQSNMDEMLDPSLAGSQTLPNEMIPEQPSVDPSLLPNASLDPRAK